MCSSHHVFKPPRVQVTTCSSHHVFKSPRVQVREEGTRSACLQSEWVALREGAKPHQSLHHWNASPPHKLPDLLRSIDAASADIQHRPLGLPAPAPPLSSRKADTQCLQDALKKQVMPAEESRRQRWQMPETGSGPKGTTQAPLQQITSATTTSVSEATCMMFPPVKISLELSQ